MTSTNPTCAACGATSKGCHGCRLLAGRHCCAECDGWHADDQAQRQQRRETDV